MIRTIIIDDEPSAVNVVSMLLQEECAADVQIVATTNFPKAAKELILKHQPDLVFLDIHMEGLSGIELLRSFDSIDFHVVFVTAYDSFAVEAFRLNAVDYLLKPVEADDVVRVVEKVKKRIQAHEKVASFGDLQKLFSDNTRTHESRICVGMADKIVFLNTDDIIYCEAKGAYSIIHLANGKSHVISKSIGDLESTLANRNFFRVHNSSIVNIRRIKEFQRHDGGYVLMDNDKKLDVSHRRRKDFLDAIDSLLL